MSLNMLYIKALHIIAVICWFAVLFYLPRLFVYHAMCEDDISKERFKVMERKLLRVIGHPSIIATHIFGIWLVTYNWGYYSQSIWFWVKIALVTALVIYYHFCIRFIKDFRDNKNTRSHVFYRWFNEVPVIVLIAIVIMAVVKPF